MHQLMPQHAGDLLWQAAATPITRADQRGLADVLMRRTYDNADGRIRGRKLQATRLRIWVKDPHCAICRRLVEYPSGFELDHRQPITSGGTNKDDNLQVLCAECHATKTNDDLGRAHSVRIGPDGWPVPIGGGRGEAQR